MAEAQIGVLIDSLSLFDQLSPTLARKIRRLVQPTTMLELGIDAKHTSDLRLWEERQRHMPRYRRHRATHDSPLGTFGIVPRTLTFCPWSAPSGPLGRLHRGRAPRSRGALPDPLPVHLLGRRKHAQAPARTLDDPESPSCADAVHGVTLHNTRPTTALDSSPSVKTRRPRGGRYPVRPEQPRRTSQDPATDGSPRQDEGHSPDEGIRFHSCPVPGRGRLPRILQVQEPSGVVPPPLSHSPFHAVARPAAARRRPEFSHPPSH